MAGGPDDPLGTVRAGDGTLAVRASTVNAEAVDGLSWFIIDIGGDILGQVHHPEDVEHLIDTWPVVYQPEPATTHRL